MILKLFFLATLVSHSFALPNRVKRQTPNAILQNWNDIRTFLTSDENPATNTTYTCTDHCSIWGNVTQALVNYPPPVVYDLCSSSFNASMVDCTQCLSAYFSTNLRQPDLLRKLTEYQRFMQVQACAATFTDSTPSPSPSPSDSTPPDADPQTDTPTAAPDATTDSLNTPSPDSTDPAPTPTDTGDSSAITDTPPSDASSPPSSNTDGTSTLASVDPSATDVTSPLNSTTDTNVPPVSFPPLGCGCPMVGLGATPTISSGTFATDTGAATSSIDPAATAMPPTDSPGSLPATSVADATSSTPSSLPTPVPGGEQPCPQVTSTQ